ncbi:MAG TPA: tetratricopeptide repeat protein [Gemmatimonadaceae bacterium]|nr:tetratricopeptide repeat protein [Gemmatimonadaceae bacterium]
MARASRKRVRHADRAARPATRVAAPAASPPAVAAATIRFPKWLSLAWMIILVLTTVAYLPAIRGPFHFDDTIIDRDSTTRSLRPSIALHPTAQTSVAGRPVVNYTLAINHAVNDALGVDARGPNATLGYHVLNVLLHLACATLLLGVLRRTLRRQQVSARWAEHADLFAIIIAGIWTLHPLQSEAVDYVIQRTELIVSLCYLATVYASIRAWDAASPRRRRAWYAVAVAACLAGMGSKEVMFSAPVMIVLYDRAFRLSSWRAIVSGGRLAFYGALLATEVWLVALIAGGGRSDTVGFHLGVPWTAYFYSQGWAIAHYIKLFLWPAGQSVDYGWSVVGGWRPVPGLLMLTAFAAATLVAWTRPARWGWFGLLGSWFFLLLAPSSSIVPITTEIAAERRVYLALVAVVILTVIAGDVVFRRLASVAVGASHARRRAIGVAAGGILAVGLASATFARSGTYRDLDTLWRNVTVNAPDNPRGWDNLARQELAHDPPREAEAAADLRQAIAVDSTYGPAWYNLGLIDLREGHSTDATRLFARAMAIDPNNPQAVAAYGNALVGAGEPARAIPLLERVAAGATSDQALIDVGCAYEAAGRLSDAIKAFRAALRISPGRSRAGGPLAAAVAAHEVHGDTCPPMACRCHP